LEKKSNWDLRLMVVAQVSAFPGKGKKTAWQVCEIFDDATDTFARLSETPAAIGDPYM
jgi:hypothetical protein